MADRQFIGAQVSPADAGLLTADLRDAQEYIPRDHTTYVDRRKDERIFQVTTSNNKFGEETVFDITKIGDRIMEVILHVAVGPLTTTGGTYRRFVDDALNAAIRDITINYGSQQLHVMTPYWRKHCDIKYKGIEKRNNVEVSAGGKLTAVQRNQLATGDQDFYVHLPVYWENIWCHYPVLNALSNNVKFTIRYNELAKLVETDGTVPVAEMKRQELIVHLLHTTGNERNFNVSLTKDESGIIYLADGQEYDSNILVTTADTALAEYVKELRNFKHPCKELVFSFRDANQINSAGVLAEREYFNFDDEELLPDEIELESNGIKILRRISDLKKYGIPFYQNRAYSGYLSGLFSIPFADAPECKNESNGHFTIGSASNVVLRLKWRNPSTRDIRLDIMNVYHKFIQHQGGELHVIFR